MPVISCPKCQTRFKVAASAGGKVVKCKNCGSKFRIPDFENAKAPSEPEPPVIELEGPREALLIEHNAQAEAVVPAATYATNDVVFNELPTVDKPYAGYLNAVGRSLAFPFNVGNLVTYLIVCFIMVAGLFIGGLAPCIGWLVVLIVSAWFMSFQLNIVVGAAAGDPDLPDMALTGGWFDGVLIPLVRMLIATVASQLPAAIFVVVMERKFGATTFEAVLAAVGMIFNSDYGVLVQSGTMATQMVGVLLLFAGLAMWPMFILVVAVGSTSGLIRLDLMCTTIWRSLLAYGLVLLFVYAGEAGIMILSYLVKQAIGSGRLIVPGSFVRVIVLGSAMLGFVVYCKVVTMRAIGLYYHFFKDKFAWYWG